jgi:peptidoglycan/xylan/chitin deacetylase (PgdA/CDA1 family)
VRFDTGVIVGSVAAERLRQRLAASPTVRALARRLPTPIREALKRGGNGAPAGRPSRRGSRTARVILMYHRVASAPADPLELCVAPALFREHVSLLQSLGEVVPLRALARPRRTRRGLRFAVTFDDGYADNALAAQPVLEAMGAPATVFVVAGSIGERTFWWDRLANLVFERAAGPRLELILDGQSFSLDVDSPAGRRRAYWTVWSRLRVLPSAQIGEVLESLEHTLGPSASSPDARPLTEVELRSLAEGGVEIGAHTISHPSLPAGSPEQQRREIDGSRSLLEEMLERPVPAFAYPYGDYDSTTVRLVKRGGFDTACTVQEGRVSALSSRLLLPRYPVRNWPAEDLERRLHGWLRGV